LVLPEDDPEPEAPPEAAPLLPVAPVLLPPAPLLVVPLLLPALPPVLEPLPLAPAPAVPYFCTHCSFSVPVMPTHWLGRALLSVELPLPAVLPPLPAEPPLPVVLLPEPLDPVAAAPPLAPVEPDEPPAVPEDCDHDTVATPSNAAVTAALSTLFTIHAPLEDKLGGLHGPRCKRDAVRLYGDPPVRKSATSGCRGECL
jgi:hypothetical protein